MGNKNSKFYPYAEILFFASKKWVYSHRKAYIPWKNFTA